MDQAVELSSIPEFVPDSDPGQRLRGLHFFVATVKSLSENASFTVTKFDVGGVS